MGRSTVDLCILMGEGVRMKKLSHEDLTRLYHNTALDMWLDGPCGRCGVIGNKGKMYEHNRFTESICSDCQKGEDEIKLYKTLIVNRGWL